MFKCRSNLVFINYFNNSLFLVFRRSNHIFVNNNEVTYSNDYKYHLLRYFSQKWCNNLVITIFARK